jgi:chromosome segregation ATPase
MAEDDQDITKKSIISRITDKLFTEESDSGKVRQQVGENRQENMNTVDAVEHGTGKQDSMESIIAEIEKFDWNTVLKDIRTAVEKQGVTITKFMGLVKSLEDVIPDEDKRFRAAYKALRATSDKGRDDMMADTSLQLNSLKSQKEIFNKTVNLWRRRLQDFTEKGKDLRRDINVLQEKLRSLEKQERQILDLAGDKERQIKHAEVKFGDFIREIEQDIKDFSNRISDLLPKE